MISSSVSLKSTKLTKTREEKNPFTEVRLLHVLRDEIES